MRFNILLSSAGRRAGLLECFRESLAELNITGNIIAVDATPYSAAAQLADRFYVVPRCTEPAFIPEIEAICQDEEIHLIVPTIDTELPVYAEARDRFRQMGTTVAVSAPETVSICCDKILSHQWMLANGFPAPRQAYPSAVLADRSEWRLPLILKPAGGSASIGLRLVHSFEELEMLSAKAVDLIVEERVIGVEHTVNVFVDRWQRALCAVPHARLETRGGEVSKGVTVKNRELMAQAGRLMEALPGAYAALNVQCFLGADGGLRFIETNARFGGGYPLAHRAGAPMTRWLIEDAIGRECSGPFDDWEDGLTMLRYDDAVYLNKTALEGTRCDAPVYRLRS